MPRPKYKHMSPYESYLFDWFIGANGNSADEYIFDVRVGQGMLPLTRLDEPYRALSVSLSQKRIDAIRKTPQSVEIIEVKADAALSALGQLLGYRILYNDQYDTKRPVTLTVVTDFLGPDEKTYFARFGITTHEFPEASAQWRIFNTPALFR